MVTESRKREIEVKEANKKKNGCEFGWQKVVANNAGLVGGWMRGKMETYNRN